MFHLIRFLIRLSKTARLIICCKSDRSRQCERGAQNRPDTAITVDGAAAIYRLKRKKKNSRADQFGRRIPISYAVGV